jgi:hypothetical protein
MSSEKREIDGKEKEDSEWVVFDAADNHVDVENSAMSQSYIDIGASSPHFSAPYSPELEFPDVDRSLDQIYNHEETLEVTDTGESSSKEDPDNNKECKERDGANTDKSLCSDDDLPWWKRMVNNNGLSVAAVAVGAVSVLAIAMTRSSHNK